MGDERRCIGKAYPKRCVRSQCSARRRHTRVSGEMAMLPCEQTSRIHREKMVRESGGGDGDE